MSGTRFSGNSEPAEPLKYFNLVILLAGLFSAINPVLVSAHGVIGNRFFPSTLAIEDPFVNDELSIVGGRIKEPGEDGEPSARVTSLEADYAKTITPNIALSIGDEYVRVNPSGENTHTGFGNLELGVKYQFYTNTLTERVVSAALGASVGYTGNTDLEANRFTTLSPAILFGQGFGRLPDSVALLRPLALTGSLDLNFPLEAHSTVAGDKISNPVTTDWGVALMYNLHYLQTSVRDVGLKAPFNRMVPIIEVVGETCLNRGCGGDITGFVNPGIIWIGKQFQLGVEAQIPVNNRTGDDVGVLLQVHLFLDDIFPRTLGRPLLTTAKEL